MATIPGNEIAQSADREKARVRLTALNQPALLSSRQAIAAFARIGAIALHVLPKPGVPAPGAADPRIIDVNTAASKNGCVAAMPWQRQTLPTRSAGATIETLDDNDHTG
jgi:hypothetical protein